MKLKTPVTPHAVAHKAERRVITVLSAFSLNVRHRAANALDVVRFSLIYFGLNVRPWKRGVTWVCLALNIVLAFALAAVGNPVAFVALFGVWSATNYLHGTRRPK